MADSASSAEAAAKTATATGPLLDVQELKTYFHTRDGLARVVDGVSFAIEHGKTVALVGESGSGKTVLSLSILRLIPPSAHFETMGRIEFEGRDLLELSPEEMRAIRGGQIAMIFQEPSTSLNPVFTIGNQIAEALRLHRDLPEAEIPAEVVRLLSEVRINDPQRCANQYPHELSGGVKQRAMIAMALAGQPKLLIADEPTTALDVTTQAHILDLLRSTQAASGMAILLITHDLGVVAEIADEVVVLYAGKIVEKAAASELFARSYHPYTQGLFESLFQFDRRRKRLKTIEGNVPAPTEYPKGCRFRTRCPMAADRCAEEPPLEEVEPGRWSACWFAREVAGESSSEKQGQR